MSSIEEIMADINIQVAKEILGKEPENGCSRDDLWGHLGSLQWATRELLKILEKKGDIMDITELTCSRCGRRGNAILPEGMFWELTADYDLVCWECVRPEDVS